VRFIYPTWPDCTGQRNRIREARIQISQNQ